MAYKSAVHDATIEELHARRDACLAVKAFFDALTELTEVGVQTATAEKAEPASRQLERVVRLPGQLAKTADTPAWTSKRAKEPTPTLLTWLATNQPAGTKAIARALAVRVAPVRHALQGLAREHRVYSTGQRFSQRWHLHGHGDPFAEVLPISSAADVPAESRDREGREPRPQPAERKSDTVPHAPPPEQVAEAQKLARRYSHALGGFKPSATGAAAAFVARCRGCDTYVSIARDGKVGGPGVRHECAFAARRA